MTEQEKTYATIVRHVPGFGAPALGRLKGVDGENLLPVYSSVEAAEAHALVMGSEWRVIEGTREDVAVLRELAADGERLAVDPPLAMQDGPPQPVRAMTVEELLEG
jgi:hypothetical protein